MESEQNSFKELCKRREKCLIFVENCDVSGKVDLKERLKTVQKHEEHLAELWKRLEIDAVKGDPSLKLKNRGTDGENIFFALPFLLFNWALEEPENEIKS